MRPLVLAPHRSWEPGFRVPQGLVLGLRFASSVVMACILTGMPRPDRAVAFPGVAGVRPPPTAGLNGPVEAAICFEKTLVLAGSFSAAGGVVTGPVACWNGFRWMPLGAPLDGPVRALAVLQGNLIAAGEFTHSGGVPVAHVARWNGRTWEPLGLGTDGPVHALAVQSDVFLYAGGAFHHAGGTAAHGIARYVLGAWSNVGDGVEGEVRALAVYNGALVAGGDFVLPGSPGYDRHLARFTNGTWQILGWGIDAPVSALMVWNGGLIAGGAFTQIDFVTPARGIAIFVGETWNEIGVGFTSMNGGAEVRSLSTDDAGLIAGGAFESAGMSPAPNVARWDGTSWSAIDEGTNGAVTALCAYGSVLVAGGAFTRAGQSAADCVAALADGRWCTLEETPVGVQDVQISRIGAAIRLEWHLAPEILAGGGGVLVERAAEPDASGEPVTPQPLAVATHMWVVDPAPDPARSWYRIVLVYADGRRVLGTAVQAPAGAAARTAIRAVSAGSAPGAVAVSYALATGGPVRLDVCDVRGRRIGLLVHGLQEAGSHRVEWAADGEHRSVLPHGIYFARLQAGGTQSVRRFHMPAASR